MVYYSLSLPLVIDSSIGQSNIGLGLKMQKLAGEAA